MADCNLKRRWKTSGFFSEIAERRWLFCMCSFCGNMQKVTIVAYGKYVVVSFGFWLVGCLGA